MQWTMPVMLFVLWALGMATSVRVDGYIHVLLGAAIALPLAHFFGRDDDKRPGGSKDERKRRYSNGRAQ